MAKPFRELREKMSPASQARAEAKAQQIIRDLPLAELREARELTQTQLAGALGVTQAAISKLERRTDMYLSTLHHMIRAMGGELEIRAVFPEGQIRIENLGAVGASVLAGSSPHRVLVIDQESDVRRLAASVLRRSGYQVETAQNGREAFSLVAAQHYALIVSDVRMPDWDGASLIRTLREHYGSGCPPVLLTGDSNQALGSLSDLRTLAGESVVPTVLPKPFGRRQLRRAVAEALKAS